MLDGPKATMVKSPEPVILQTIFTNEFARGGTPEVDIIRPHNSAWVAVPCTSGPPETVSIGDGGWQFSRPSAVVPVIVGESASVGLCAAGGEGVDELVEHAVKSVISSKRQRERHLTKWFLPDDIADSSLVVHSERRRAQTTDFGALL